MLVRGLLHSSFFSVFPAVGFAVPVGVFAADFTRGTFAEAIFPEEFPDALGAGFGADFGASEVKSALGSLDSFVSKIASDGTYVWTKHIGGSQGDYFHTVSVDNEGDIFVVDVSSTGNKFY